MMHASKYIYMYMCVFFCSSAFHGQDIFSRVGRGQGGPTSRVRFEAPLTTPVRFRTPPDPTRNLGNENPCFFPLFVCCSIVFW